ncbi:hypothetical protein AGABI2DRAFT_176262 [Agaricus bisporus var. bisporus H97]|uniref:hypothetical protein n=1 Tax=Agaricus bisporus var. bisporus (strain H97 / ATCC MYA-4626 / FGSC 10389) TaxID=936046 RepID=UPI00029F66E3|nr:hypothetical protein AGABI2DRAFT_176262 [Agaricus bisporus var. bisporus H97]EKV51868.1 hypothetical protein AGABI2DRAFT_176262 [Agaricus bisporus var. bisporus H97]
MLSDSGFARVVYTLRIADARCFSVARNTRVAYKPTHHAKKHSLMLGLSVDTDKATKLPVSHVSVKPYPQVVQTYSPVIESTTCVTTIRINGPTAHDLLNLNASLVEYIARVDQSTLDDERLMYPSTADCDLPVVWRPKPDVPSDVASLRSSTSGSSCTSVSSYGLMTPDDRVEQTRGQYKRKSTDMVDGFTLVDKRPKYGRKGWIETFRRQETQL